MSVINNGPKSRQAFEEFLYKEARCLDDKDWDGWLALYARNAVFWMPSWDDDDTLVEDPQREISLIYYGEKQGLEDRVFRIRTDRSSATSVLSNVGAAGFCAIASSSSRCDRSATAKAGTKSSALNSPNGAMP